MVSTSGDSVAFTRLDNVYLEERGEHRVYLYNDRPVYRPGQTVYFKGIVRWKQGADYRLPSPLPIKVEIRDPTDAQLRHAKSPARR